MLAESKSLSCRFKGILSRESNSDVPERFMETNAAYHLEYLLDHFHLVHRVQTAREVFFLHAIIKYLMLIVYKDI